MDHEVHAVDNQSLLAPSSCDCSGSWSGPGAPHEVGDLWSGAASFAYDGTPKIEGTSLRPFGDDIGADASTSTVCPATDCPASIIKCVQRIACLGNCGAIGADAVCPATDCPAPIIKCVQRTAYLGNCGDIGAEADAWQERQTSQDNRGLESTNNVQAGQDI